MAQSTDVTIAVGAYSDRYVFSGALFWSNSRIDVPALTVDIERYAHSSDLRFTCDLSATNTADLHACLKSAEPLEFRGTWEQTNLAMKFEKPSARVLLRATSWADSRIVGVAELVDTDISTLPILPSSQRLLACFTPTDFAFESVERVERTADGSERRLHLRTPRAPFIISGVNGPWELSLHRQQEEAYIGGVRAELAVPVVSMSRVVADDERVLSAADLLDQVQKDILDVERVLSFLSRRQVRCHTIHVVSDLEAEPRVQLATRHLPSWTTAPPPEALVNAESVGEQQLDNILRTFRSSEFKEPITHATNFLLGYWATQFVENQVVAAFTAFETMVNGASEIRGISRTLSKADFKELKPLLQSTIREFGIAKGMAPPTRARLYEKIPELSRSPIAPRAGAILVEQNVEWQDLWEPAETASASSLEALIRAAYGRRSRFLHAGIVEDWAELIANAATVHALTERLICRLLGVPDAWLWPFAYEHAKR